MHNMPPMPPYVPKEHQHKTRSEMPEPYKSQIDEWIERKTEWHKAQIKQARSYALAVGLIFFLITALTCFVFGALNP